MDAKLNHSEISALFAKATGLSQSEADSFSKAFFDLIIEGLESDGIVKINGLGTFKVVGVDSRESVNVSTGERIEIKGHKKLSLTPAESLKDTINAPFAMFEPVEVNEDVDDEEQLTEADDASAYDEEPMEEPVAEQAEESVEMATSFPAAEIEEEMPAEDASATVGEYRSCAIDEEMPVEEVAEQHVADSFVPERASEPVVAEVVIPEECEPVAAKVEPKEEIPASDCVAEEAPVASEPTQEQAKPAKSEIDLNAVKAPENFLANNVRPKKKKGYKYVAFLLVILIAAGAVVLFALNDGPSQSVVNDNAVAVVTPEKPAEKVEENVTVATTDTTSTPVVSDTASIANAAEDAGKIVIIEALENRPLSQITVKDTTEYVASGVMTEHVVALEETLIKISLKHYGDKKLWPYIVQYNNMERPNDLACGMVLKIPRLVPKN